MGSLDSNGIYIYDETDQISPIHTYSNLGQASTSAAIEYLHEHTLIMPVANAAERDAYASDMAAAGRPASLARPLWVERQDTGAVERNRGAGWHVMVDNTLEEYNPGGSSAAWAADNLLTKKNGWVTFKLRQKRIGSPLSTGTRTLLSSMPARFRPNTTYFVPAHIHVRQSYTRSTLMSVSTTGEVVIHNFPIATNNWLSAHATWPTDD